MQFREPIMPVDANNKIPRAEFMNRVNQLIDGHNQIQSIHGDNTWLHVDQVEGALRVWFDQRPLVAMIQATAAVMPAIITGNSGSGLYSIDSRVHDGSGGLKAATPATSYADAAYAINAHEGVTLGKLVIAHSLGVDGSGNARFVFEEPVPPYFAKITNVGGYTDPETDEEYLTTVSANPSDNGGGNPVTAVTLTLTVNPADDESHGYDLNVNDSVAYLPTGTNTGVIVPNFDDMNIDWNRLR